VTEDELIEKLATRLTEVGNEADQTGDFKWNNYRAMPAIAKECLRQMKWAQGECVESVDSFGAGNSWTAALPLTLAPDGWNG
jgi:hypothetical protein